MATYTSIWALFYSHKFNPLSVKYDNLSFTDFLWNNCEQLYIDAIKIKDTGSDGAGIHFSYDKSSIADFVNIFYPILSELKKNKALAMIHRNSEHGDIVTICNMILSGDIL